MLFEKRAACHSHSITHKEKSFQVLQRAQLAFTQTVIGGNGD